MSNLSSRVRAIAAAAADWRDPDHRSRVRAVEETLEQPNRWTEQALTHVLNRRMQQLTVDALQEWVGGDSQGPTRTVGVLHGEDEPLSGFRATLAIWLFGDSYVGCLSEASPEILPAFAADVANHGDCDVGQFADESEVYEAADVLIAQADDSTDSIQHNAERHGIPSDRCLIRPPMYSVGIIDGHESPDEMGRLAEDMILFEGTGHRRLAVLWAPTDEPPDPYLEAMAQFRGLFPAHPDTPGALQMQQAFLEARDESHAYAEGLEFLLSRGDPEPQRAGHIRWAEYESLEDVQRWLSEHEKEVYAVITRKDLHNKVSWASDVRSPGGVHVPSLEDPEGEQIISFLRSTR